MSLYVLGSNACGQLGMEFDECDLTSKPIEHPFFKEKKIVKIAAGKIHSLVLCENNELYSFGVNDDCALGRETDNQKNKECLPMIVKFKPKIADIVAGASFSAILTKSGDVYGCGTFKNSNGVFGFRLNNGEIVKFQKTFVKMNLKGIIAIAAGHNHLLAIDRQHKLWSVGANDSNQLGSQQRERSKKKCLVPSKIVVNEKDKNLVSFKSVSCGETDSFAVNQKDQVLCWGTNFNGQLGLGNTDNLKGEKGYSQIENVEYVSAGASCTFFLLKNKELFGCGDNSLSQIGIPSKKIVLTPELIMKDVDVVRAGHDFCIAQKGNKLFSWGSNLNGELGFDAVEFDEIKTATEIDFPFNKIVDFRCGNDFVLIQTE